MTEYCTWKPDTIKVYGKLRFVTTCGNKWFAGGDVFFIDCPFCGKPILIAKDKL